MKQDNLQEPVGYFYLDEGQWKQASDPISFAGCTKLYKYPPAAPDIQRHNDYMAGFNEGYDRAEKNARNTAQPAAQRQWVGLTVSDWDEISDMPDSFDQGVVWAVRKLKEKNT
jgi:hypothetical protein